MGLAWFGYNETNVSFGTIMDFFRYTKRRFLQNFEANVFQSKGIFLSKRMVRVPAFHSKNKAFFPWQVGLWKGGKSLDFHDENLFFTSHKVVGGPLVYSYKWSFVGLPKNWP